MLAVSMQSITVRALPLGIIAGGIVELQVLKGLGSMPAYQNCHKMYVFLYIQACIVILALLAPYSGLLLV